MITPPDEPADTDEAADADAAPDADDTLDLDVDTYPDTSPPSPAFRLLGPPEYVLGDDVFPISGRRQAGLFTMLAYHPGVVMSAGRLLDELWGEGLPSNPANALQSQVSRLRAVVGETTVLLRDGGYQLDVDPSSVDVVQFERLVAAGHQLLAEGRPQLAHRCLDSALRLWRGEPLTQLTQLSFVARECRRLDELHVHAIAGRARADVSLGNGQFAVGELRRLVDLHPSREDLWAQTALALYRVGRTADALDTLRTARAVLAANFGLDPGPGLRSLEARILRHDELLDLDRNEQAEPE